jgi:hypothetical protein
MKKILFVVLVVISFQGFSQTIIETVTNRKLEVMSSDLPTEMKWDDAVKSCQNLGGGWRLPDSYELKLMYKNRYTIGGFKECSYWSTWEESASAAYSVLFINGVQNSWSKSSKSCVRCIRDVK